MTAVIPTLFLVVALGDDFDVVFLGPATGAADYDGVLAVATLRRLLSRLRGLRVFPVGRRSASGDPDLSDGVAERYLTARIVSFADSIT